MLFIILSIIVTFLFILTDYGSFLIYGIFKIAGLLVNLYFNCFILLGVLMLNVKLKVTSMVGDKI